MGFFKKWNPSTDQRLRKRVRCVARTIRLRSRRVQDLAHSVELPGN